MQDTLREVEFAGRIGPGMDVCDITGEKIGAVAHVHRRTGRPGEDRVIEVKSGFLGLGGHWWIPLGAVHDMTDGCVFLGVDKDTPEARAWHERPADLES
jgi:hypothetical protein